MPKPKPSTIKLQVFKGREAKLNKAIFHILALQGPLTIYDIHKEVKAQRGLESTRYASVNKRVKFLEESSYIRRAGIRKTKAGFEAVTFDLMVRAYLAMLFDLTSLEHYVRKVDEEAVLTILATMLGSEC